MSSYQTALQDVERHHGPTRFVPGTHTGAAGEEAHARLATESSDGDAVPHAFCSSASTVVALLRAGEVSLYDSRLLHCGGPNLGVEGPGPTDQQPKRQPPEVERVLFALSFVVAGAGVGLSLAELDCIDR